MMELEEPSGFLPAGEIVLQNYCIMGVIGAGTFGVVYKALHIGTHQRVAVKVASAKAPDTMLRTEFELYKILQSEEVITPKVYEIGQVHGRPAIVMERLGFSLKAMFEYCRYHFRPETVAQLAVQMIERLAWFHKITGYVHRDVKPDNFVLGFGKNRNLVHLIDFGLAEPYFDWSIKRHIRGSRTSHGLAGTARFASRNAHLGHAQSRRDDMESLGYSLVYLMRGSLPWQGMKAVTRNQLLEKTTEKKLSISIQELCDGLPGQFAAMLEHSQELGYTIEPDYDVLIAKFRQLCRKPDGSTATVLLFDRVPYRPITKRTKATEPEHAKSARKSLERKKR
uniref:non-specific serine/threonine protein kinase n=1 Tax=Anopheles atroparvus TaxID=41427 RepID=A0A182J748_ANOAO